MSDAPALSQDQVSGAFFVRLNAIAFVAGLLLCGAALALAPPPPAPAGWLAGQHWLKHAGQVEVSRYSLDGVASDTLTLVVGQTDDALRLEARDPTGAGTTVEVSPSTGRLLRARAHGWRGPERERRPRDPRALIRSQLPLFLRANPEPGVEALVWPPSGEESIAVSFEATRQRLSVPAGTFSCVRYDLRFEDQVLGSYWVADTPERELVSFTVGAKAAHLVSRAWRSPSR